MDVDRTSFWPKLPSILKAISEAKFVSVDLEMSGIMMNTLGSEPNPTLQQIYQDARAAAETFAILQRVGFSSKTIAFLQENGFSFADVFSKGVPYLSIIEAAQKDIINFAKNKDKDDDHIDISQLPPQTREFYSDVQAKLRAWMNKWIYEAEIKPLRIENPLGGRLNNLQKRLIYQLVEVEFKDCRAYSKAGSAYMEVVELEAKEQPVSGRVKAKRKQAVVKQTGIRFLWDAICGRLFADKIDPDLIVGENPVKIIQLKRDMKEYERQLRSQSPVFVGHNILWDLCFLHGTFVGSLPERVEDFRTIVRERLPRVVDTKYLFTRGGHEMLPDQNLEECFATVKTEKHPTVRPDPVYSYLAPRPHQAGYDSYMTAVVFIKKSYQLRQANQGLEFNDAEDSTEAIAPSRSSPTLTKLPPAQRSLRSSSLAVQAPRRIPAVPSAIVPPRPTRSGSLLDDDDDDGSAARLANYAALEPEVSMAHTPVPSAQETEPGLSSTNSTVPSTQETKPVGLAKVPAWEGTFWKRYGNKSRVGPFGQMFYTGRNG